MAKTHRVYVRDEPFKNRGHLTSAMNRSKLIAVIAIVAIVVIALRRRRSRHPEDEIDRID